jgi:chaperonin cofactor prefoldin
MEVIKEMNKKLISIAMIITLACFSPQLIFAQTPKEIQKDIQEIKERLIRLDERVNALEKRMNDFGKRIDDLDNKLSKRIDDLANLIYVMLAAMFMLFGFVIWDRRTALAPAIRKSKELEEREEKLERALKEFAIKNPEMKEILKDLGLL